MAAPAALMSNLSAALKRNYSQKFVSRLEWSRGGKALAMVPKVVTAGQPTWAYTVGTSAAVSADFVTAQNQAASQFTAIQQPVISLYQQDFGLATIEGRLMAAAASKEGTLFNKMVGQIDGIVGGVLLSQSGKIYRQGYGKMSTIGAATNVATTTIILEFPEDSVQFERGMLLQFSQSESGHVLRNGGATLAIVDIDFTAGTLVMAAATNTVTGTVAGDTIFRAGDRQNSATPAKLCITGFEGQFNASDALFGVTRTGDSRLRGISIASLGKTEETAIIDGLSEVQRYGGTTDWVFMNPTRWRNIAKLAQGRYRPTTLSSPIPGVGIRGFQLMTMGGDVVEVYADPFCPVNRIFGIEKDSLQLFCGVSTQIPRFLDDDGNGQVLRLAAADGVESRVGVYDELGCNAPIHNFCLTY